MTLREIVQILVFFPPLINLYAFWCQVETNHRLRTSVGLSAIMMMMRYTAAIAQITYLWMLQMNYAYRIMIMPQWALIVVLVAQQIYYAPNKLERWGVVSATTILSIAWLAAFVYGYGAGQEQLVGDFCGWLLFSIATCVQVPQIYWNWRRRSVHGYSIHFVLFSVSALCVDFLFAHILGVPLQTYFIYTGALLYRAVELIQFWTYPHNTDPVALDDRLYTG